MARIPRDQIGGVLVALRMGFKTHANASRRIAPERQCLADTRVPIFSHHGVHFILGRAHTGEMGHGLELCLVANLFTVLRVRSRVVPPAP